MGRRDVASIRRNLGKEGNCMNGIFIAREDIREIATHPVNCDCKLCLKWWWFIGGDWANNFEDLERVEG